jgi:NADP-dependent aldehyde dehydrogenase
MLPDEFPVSTWADCDATLAAAAEAATTLRTVPPEQIAKFLMRFAEHIEARKSELVEMAPVETALPKAPRLAEVELPPPPASCARPPPRCSKARGRCQRLTQN